MNSRSEKKLLNGLSTRHEEFIRILAEGRTIPKQDVKDLTREAGDAAKAVKKSSIRRKINGIKKRWEGAELVR